MLKISEKNSLFRMRKNLTKAAVLARWKGQHNPSRLASSSVPSWLLGLIWSTVVAGIARPLRSQDWHRCLSRWRMPPEWWSTCNRRLVRGGSCPADGSPSQYCGVHYNSHIGLWSYCDSHAYGWLLVLVLAYIPNRKHHQQWAMRKFNALIL